MSDLFDSGDVVHRYTRAEAIADGVLVDISADPELGPLVQQAGLRFPLAMTAEAFSLYVALTPAAKQAGCDIKGRLWDILTMLHRAIRRELARDSDTDSVVFGFLCVVDEPRPVRVRLKAVVGPNDSGAPVFTLLLPEQD